MANGDDFPVLCNICEQRDKFDSPAFCYCPECDELFCSSCEEHHKIAKISKSHIIMPIQHYKELSNVLSNISQSCTVHNKIFEMFCETHSQPCCIECTSENHSTCTNVKLISDIAKNFKSSESLFYIESRTQELIDFIASLQNEQMDHLSDVDKQAAECLKEKNKTRDEMLENIHKADKKLEDEIKQACDKARNAAKTTFEDLENKTETMKKLADNILRIKNYATDRQAFLSLGLLEKGLIAEETNIVELAKTLTRSDIKVIKPGVHPIYTDLSFGDIKVQQSPIKSKLTNKKETEAQIFLTTQLTLDEVQTEFERNFIVAPNVTTNLLGCLSTEDGIVLFADYSENKRLIVMSKTDGSLIKTINLPLEPKYIARNRGNTVAVSCDDSRILVVDIRKGHILNEIHEKAIGLAYLNDFIVVGNKTALKKFDQNGKVISKINFFPHNHQLMTCSQNMYITRYAETVNCFDEKGNLQWSFFDERLKKILGICLDKYKNVFVASFETDSIIILSCDGKKWKELLTDVRCPTGVHVNNETSELIVCQKRNCGSLYKIKYAFD